MTEKVKVNLTMDREVVERAKKIGLNLSQFCENCLKEAIEALEQRKQRTETNGGYTDARSASRTAMVGRAGFEPATFCTSSRCPNRARLPALVGDREMLSHFDIFNGFEVSK